MPNFAQLIPERFRHSRKLRWLTGAGLVWLTIETLLALAAAFWFTR